MMPSRGDGVTLGTVGVIVSPEDDTIRFSVQVGDVERVYEVDPQGAFVLVDEVPT